MRQLTVPNSEYFGVQNHKHWEGKPWHGLSGELKRIFGKKMVKLSLDGGFTCPNRDGTLGTQGCAFCSVEGSGNRAGSFTESIDHQLTTQKELLRRKWPDAGCIAYFQSFTGTYGHPEDLERIYSEALNDPEIQGIAIATRPDCLGPKVLEILERIQERTFLWVELGLQTIHDQTASGFGRGYTADCFYRAYKALEDRGIPVVVHLINGLPGETPEMMLESARALSILAPWGVKLHLLHIIKGTQLESLWRAGMYVPLTQTAYVTVIADQLEILPSSTVIHRLTGDGASAALLAPDWSRNKKGVLGAIETEMRRRGSWQGCRLDL